MKEKGIPAISMLQSKDNTPFINIEDQIFAVYSFVESDRSHIYSNDDYFRIGQMLAKIHLISKDSIQIDLELKTVKNNDIVKTKEILKSYKERIESKEMKDETDVLFLQYINLKLKILETMKDSVEIYNHPEHILHGDYHAGNLLIDKDSRGIIGVCDWEKNRKGESSI
jgi:aminoglycoside phosphotransferase (APT) family kinase protein